MANTYSESDPDFPFPKPLFRTSEEICRMADKLRNETGFKTGDKIDDLVTMLGGKVELEDSWASTAPANPVSMYVHGERDFKIVVPTSATRERQNFLKAHEVGHYILHFLVRRILERNGGAASVLKKMKTRRFGETASEQEANWFAASLLMPAKELKAELKSQAENMYSIAKKFNVTPYDAKRRVEYLKQNNC